MAAACSASRRRSREVVESQKTEAALLPSGETSVELISPRGNEGLARFLEKRGPGLHHIAVEVEGIETRHRACSRAWACP